MRAVRTGRPGPDQGAHDEGAANEGAREEGAFDELAARRRLDARQAGSPPSTSQSGSKSGSNPGGLAPTAPGGEVEEGRTSGEHGRGNEHGHGNRQHGGRSSLGQHASGTDGPAGDQGSGDQDAGDQNTDSELLALGHRMELAQVLADFAGDLLTDFNVEVVLRRLCERLPRVLPIDGAGVSLLDHDQLRFAQASTSELAEAERTQQRLGQGPCFDAVASGQLGKFLIT